MHDGLMRTNFTGWSQIQITKVSLLHYTSNDIRTLYEILKLGTPKYIGRYSKGNVFHIGNYNVPYKMCHAGDQGQEDMEHSCKHIEELIHCGSQEIHFCHPVGHIANPISNCRLRYHSTNASWRCWTWPQPTIDDHLRKIENIIQGIPCLSNASESRGRRPECKHQLGQMLGEWKYTSRISTLFAPELFWNVDMN